MMETMLKERNGVPLFFSAIALVPVAKLVLMLWEYQFLMPMSPLAHWLIIVSVLLISCTLGGVAARSHVFPFVVGVAAWSCLAYLVVSFFPGCMWAACW